MTCADHVQTLLFLKQCGNYLHNLFVVVGFIDNLDVVYSVWEGVCRWYANTRSQRHLKHLSFGICRGPGTNPKSILKNDCCLIVRASIAVIKFHNQKQLGELISAYSSASQSSPPKELRAGTQGRNWCRVREGVLLTTDLISHLLRPHSLFHTAHDLFPRDGTTPRAGPSTSITIKKIAHRLAHRRFLIGGSLFPNDAILCQVDKGRGGRGGIKKKKNPSKNI